MWLVVGLGNPGAEYEGTRHNLGFEVCDLFARRRAWNYWKTGHKGLYVEGSLLPSGGGAGAGVDVALLKPMTFMNRSGRAVQVATAAWKLKPGRVLVVSDDLDLPLGKIRVRAGGGAGGHKGLRSVIEVLGPEFPRLRLGLGDSRGDPADWVLKPFPKVERDDAAIMVERAADIVECLLVEGVTEAMNRFNGDQAGGGKDRRPARREK